MVSTTKIIVTIYVPCTFVLSLSSYKFKKKIIFAVRKRKGLIEMLPDYSALHNSTEIDDDYDFALELRPDDAYR